MDVKLTDEEIQGCLKDPHPDTKVIFYFKYLTKVITDISLI